MGAPQQEQNIKPETVAARPPYVLKKIKTGEKLEEQSKIVH